MVDESERAFEQRMGGFFFDLEDALRTRSVITEDEFSDHLRFLYRKGGGESKDGRLDASSREFYYMNTWRAHLDLAVFDDCSFNSCDLRSSHFLGASFRNAVFRGTNLSWVDFRGADLTNAKFDGCDLSYAAFSGSDLSGASFDGNNLRGTGLSTSVWRMPKTASYDSNGGIYLYRTRRIPLMSEYSPVERYDPGREYTSGVIGHDPNEERPGIHAYTTMERVTDDYPGEQVIKIHARAGDYVYVGDGSMVRCRRMFVLMIMEGDNENGLGD